MWWLQCSCTPILLWHKDTSRERVVTFPFFLSQVEHFFFIFFFTEVLKKKKHMYFFPAKNLPKFWHLTYVMFDICTYDLTYHSASFWSGSVTCVLLSRQYEQLLLLLLVIFAGRKVALLSRRQSKVIFLWFTYVISMS